MSLTELGTTRRDSMHESMPPTHARIYRDDNLFSLLASVTLKNISRVVSLNLSFIIGITGINMKVTQIVGVEIY